MSDGPFKYQRIHGRGRRTTGWIAVAAAKSTLWLGPDHLLSVDRVWMNETYKRFYFRDIQAITIQRTNGASAGNWILGTLGVCCVILTGALLMEVSTSTARIGIFIAGGIISAFWFICLSINLARGVSCICRVRTAVQTEVLPSLGRIPAAHNAIAILKPLIEQTQEALPAEDISRRVLETATRTVPAAASQSPSTPPPQIKAPSSGLLHFALYAVLLLDAAAGFYKHFQMGWHLYLGVSAILIMALCALSLAAVVRQREAAVPDGLRQLTVIACTTVLAILFIVFIYGFVFRTGYQMRHPGRLPSSIDFYSLGGFKTLSAVADFMEAGLGIAGLALTLTWVIGRRSQAVREAEAPQDQSRPVS